MMIRTSWTPLASVLLVGALTLWAPVAASEVAINAELTLFDPGAPETPDDDIYGLFYWLDDVFPYEKSYGISFFIPEDGLYADAFQYIAHTDYIGALLVPDPNLGAPGSFEVKANYPDDDSPDYASALVMAPLFSPVEGMEEYRTTHPFTVWDPDYDPVETGIATVPEPMLALTQLAALAALGGLAFARRRRARPRMIAGPIASAGLLTALMLLVLPPSAHATPVAIEGAPVLESSFGAFKIEFQAVEYERVAISNSEYRFDVWVTNEDTVVTQAFGLEPSGKGIWSLVVHDVLPVPMLGVGEKVKLASDLVIVQHREQPFDPDDIDWKVAVAPPAGLPESDARIAAIDSYIASLNVDKQDPDWKGTISVPIPDTTAFDPDRTYFWHLNTNVGELRLRFMPEWAPVHVSNTIFLTRLGFYDNVIFHRVLREFVAQGGDPFAEVGDPNGTNGTGGPLGGYGGEFPFGAPGHARRGVLSMANAGEGTDGSQFFITFKPTPLLDGKHTIFGVLADGPSFKVFDTFEHVSVPTGGPADPIEPTSPLIIESATISVE